jgi:hypothetical protein
VSKTSVRMGFAPDKHFETKYGNKPRTAEVGGKVCRFRSGGEYDLACYLELLKIGGYIRDWAFEQTTFRFPFGVRYLVDFDVINNDGTFEYYEFKGQFKNSDRLKLATLFDKRPEVKLTIVFKNRREAAKIARSKIAGGFKRICLLGKTGLDDFDGKVPRKRKPKREKL